MTVCAIHQPNFFPWRGFFDKILHADVFVFLDDVSYPRSGSKSMASWSNRVKIDVKGQPSWFSRPVVKAPLGTKIKDVKLTGADGWPSEAWARLENSYGAYGGFSQASALIKELLDYPAENIADFNVNAIKALSRFMGLEVEFVRQSELSTAKASTELLVEICKKVDADTYLCGGGASGYQDDNIFDAHNVNLLYQDYEPSSYGPDGTYLPGLSVLDYLFKEPQ